MEQPAKQGSMGMEKTVQSNAGRAQDSPAVSSARSRGMPAHVQQSGPLTQLAAFANESPRVQGLMDLAGTINQGPPAQRMLDPRATLSQSDRSGAVDGIAVESGGLSSGSPSSGGQSSEQSSCG